MVSLYVFLKHINVPKGDDGWLLWFLYFIILSRKIIVNAGNIIP